MKKRNLMLTALLLVPALIFTGCGNAEKVEAPEAEVFESKPAAIEKHETSPEPTEPPFTPLSLQEQNRLYCHADYFEYEGKIYSNFFDNNQELHFGCVEKGHSANEYVLLLDDPASYCEVIDGKLYVLTSQCEDSALYRCSLDMSEMELMLTLPNRNISHYMQYYEGYFYYNDSNNDYRYYRLPIDGSEPELIIDKAVYYPLIHDGWILYQDDADSESLHWMELSGGADYKITSVPSCCAYLDGEYIYFAGKYDDLSTHRIKHDGTDDQIIFTADCFGDYGIDENYIYFSADKPNCYIFRVDKDGGNMMQLGTEPSNEDPFIVDGMVLVKHVSDNMKYYYGYKYLDAETGEYIKELN